MRQSELNCPAAHMAGSRTRLSAPRWLDPLVFASPIVAVRCAYSASTHHRGCSPLRRVLSVLDGGGWTSRQRARRLRIRQTEPLTKAAQRSPSTTAARMMKRAAAARLSTPRIRNPTGGNDDCRVMVGPFLSSRVSISPSSMTARGLWHSAGSAQIATSPITHPERHRPVSRSVAARARTAVRTRPYRHICATCDRGTGRPYCRICATPR